jgi:hypothetical protein
MRRLNGVDALMLYTETPEIHMHTLKIGVLDVSGVEGGFSFDLFRSVAYPRLLAMAPLRHQLVDVPLKLRLTAMATTIAKENNQLLGPTLLPAWLSYLPPSLAPGMFRRQANRMESASVMNLTISNVPGPRERGHIEGAIVSEIYSVGPVVTGSGMNITVWSYVDQLAISVLTDDLTLDDPHEATDAMIDAFTEIRSAAGLSTDLTPVGSAMPLAAAAG